MNNRFNILHFIIQKPLEHLMDMGESKDLMFIRINQLWNLLNNIFCQLLMKVNYYYYLYAMLRIANKFLSQSILNRL